MPRTGALRIARDLVHFALENKRWWILPVIVVALLLISLVVVSSTPVAPFIYTLF